VRPFIPPGAGSYSNSIPVLSFVGWPEWLRIVFSKITPFISFDISRIFSVHWPDEEYEEMVSPSEVLIVTCPSSSGGVPLISMDADPVICLLLVRSSVADLSEL